MVLMEDLNILLDRFDGVGREVVGTVTGCGTVGFEFLQFFNESVGETFKDRCFVGAVWIGVGLIAAPLVPPGSLAGARQVNKVVGS